MKKIFAFLIILITTNIYALDINSIDPLVTAKCAGVAQAYTAYAKATKASQGAINGFEKMDSAWRGLTVNIMKRKGVSNFEYYDNAITQQRDQILRLLDSNFSSGRDLLVKRDAECVKLSDAITKN